MNHLELIGVTKKFEQFKAVDNVSLEIGKGEFVVLLGPSGCGKSTLLRLVAGLEIPDDGKIQIGERDVTHRESAERDLAMVFQSYALYPHMTIAENISYPLKIRKFSQDEINRSVSQVAVKLGLTELLTRRPRELSGGQRQRVALARAIVRKPQAFLMDEPLSNLDAGLRVQMRAELKHLHKELGTTSIYVTHDQTEAMTLAQRIAVMNKGKLMQFETPLKIYSNPANTFVAKFVGSPAMNFFEGAVNNRYFENPQMKLALSELSLQGVSPDRIRSAFTLGVRPEDILVVRQPVDGYCKAKVFITEELGNENFLVLTPGNDQPDGTQIDPRSAESRITVRVPSDFRVQEDEDVWFTVRENKVHFFDLESGANLKKPI